MANNIENIEKLTHAVTSLNNDAVGMHEMIQRESSHLEETLTIERRASEDLEMSIKTLQGVVDLIPHRLESIDRATEDVKVKTTASLDATVEQIKAIRNEGLKAFEEMTDSLEHRHSSIEESFKSFEECSLKEAQKGRSEIQSDILSHKTAISARIDSLENEVVSLKSSIQGFDERIAHAKEEIKMSIRPLLLIGIGVVVMEIVAIVLTVLV